MSSACASLLLSMRTMSLHNQLMDNRKDGRTPNWQVVVDEWVYWFVVSKSIAAILK